jgi:hypothetical protein
MKKLTVLLMLVTVSFPAMAILVEAQDDQASMALASSLHFIGFGAGY